MASEINTEQGLDILRRLHHVFTLALQRVEDPTRGQIWIISGKEGEGRPTIRGVDSKEQVIKVIHELRVAQLKDTTTVHYVYIIAGRRWVLQKGREWQLWDGETMTALQEVGLIEGLDDDGTLIGTVDLDQVRLPSEETDTLKKVDDSTATLISSDSSLTLMNTASFGGLPLEDESDDDTDGSPDDDDGD